LYGGAIEKKQPRGENIMEGGEKPNEGGVRKVQQFKSVRGSGFRYGARY